ncbi:uncharacterized protein LOC113635460 [Tachysurus fulvidraco]|uniref:uncharacterized protein LOC113635460 n=2 Tax=Tachysurus fulvidraco TaxID=1234273 RepID=UPI001FEE45DB|nr:uncharacterized protein LOC113635460 [Tachysurus fulvidraco]
MQSPASRGRTLSEDQFSCSICLEVFVEPVSTPCGHSFCKACLQGYWTHSNKIVCPMCKKTFSKKPELCVNRVLAEIAEQFQGLSVAQGGGTEGVVSPRLEERDEDIGEFAKPGDVPCDACIGRKLKALKSCLSCPGSFCKAHLQHHRKVKAMSKHKLVEPIHHLQEKVCKKHERLLDVYCRKEHMCVCRECAEVSHKTHNTIPVEREYKKISGQLGTRRSELKHLIKERVKKLDEIKQSIAVIKSSSQREIEESWAVYAELQRLLEKSQAQLVEHITFRQKLAEEQARDLANRLEHELNILKNRSCDLDTLANTQDKVFFLQLLPNLPPPPEPTDWTGVSVNTDLYLGTIRKSVSALVERFQEEVKRLYGKELRKVQNYASEVLIDPSTAQRNLVVSEDSQQVHYEEGRKASSQSDNPRRFSPALFVLAHEGLSSGRHYWEVDVGRKTAWTLGVARASVRRKGDIRLSPEGGFWCLWLKNNEVKALASSRIPLQLPTLPQKVGVYLDYEGGQISFYDVKAQNHLYTFMDTFDGSVYPIFSPCASQDGTNSGALCITSVKHRMASPTNMLAEEQVHCSICLDVFTNPVSIPCGHNFCMACIGGYWKTSSLFMCPMCKKTFFKKPDISINTVLREIAEQFKDMKIKPVLKEQQPQQQHEPEKLLKDLDWEIPELIPPSGSLIERVCCDVCTGPQQQAVKSCLVCLTSYCEEHLKTHTARFTKHKLIEPVQNLEDRMCKKHERLLELFCKKDQIMVCVLCTEMDHRAHYTVPVEREWSDKKALLRKTEAEVQQMIQERLQKVEDIKHCIELNKHSALREIEDSVQVFSNLVRKVQKAQAELVIAIEEKQRKTAQWAQGLIEELEREIVQLKKRNSEIDHLARTDDHIYFLQKLPSLITHPQTKDWSEAHVPTNQCLGTIRRAVSKLEESLAEEIEKLAESELKTAQKYSMDVTLDPDTANPWLQLSEDRRQLRHLGAWQDLPDTPDRFNTVVITLGCEGFTSGRHYWEVQVGEKDDWYLGVAKESVNRKGRIAISTSHGYWALAMKKGQEYRVSSSPPIILPVNPKLKRVGVYVDFEEGHLSFYDTISRSHIYTFVDSFQEKLYPFFYLYCCDKASDILSICPVMDITHNKQC